MTPEEMDAQADLPPERPLQVFSHGPWLFEETGQHFTGAQLDAAAFAIYRVELSTLRAQQAEAVREIEVLKQRLSDALGPI